VSKWEIKQNPEPTTVGAGGYAIRENGLTIGYMADEEDARLAAAAPALVKAARDIRDYARSPEGRTFAFEPGIVDLIAALSEAEKG